MQTKLVLLGTGTPNACPNANGPSSAVVVGDRAYLVDFGPGVVRQASAAYFNGVDALRPDLLTVAFCTHLHTDHTAGYPDLIFTPWVLERPVPLKVFGPKGLQHMTDHILQAYETDIDFRIHGFEKANESGYRVEVTEIESGIVYRDDLVTVEAFPVSHGTLECYGYKFTTPDRTIVITGDTAPLDLVAEKSKGCDILLHEVEYAAGISCREPKWQKYHREVHTLSTDLAGVAKKANPKLLVTYHRIYHMNVQDNHKNLAAEMAWRDAAILDEIRDAGYDGYVVNGKTWMYFKIRGSVPILVYELVRCPVRFGMSPETLSIFIYPTGRFYHTLRYFRTVFSLTLTSSERIIIVLQLWQNSRIFCCLSLQEPDPQTACTVCLSFAFQKGCFIWQLLLRNP